MLSTAGLAVGYHARRRRTTVLAGLDLALEPGELICLLGPNGSGKSTLLRTLAGLQEPLAGEVRLLGERLPRLGALERARRLAVVLTDQPDVGLMRAADLVALGRHPHTGWSGRLGADDHAQVRWALEATGATALAHRSVAELSDGERQRVLIARALAQRPAVLALDEPIAFVDVPRRVELTQLLRRLARDSGLAVLLTTHDLDLAIRSADKLWLLEPLAGGGADLHVAAPEDLVLSGAIGRSFASAETHFDVTRGVFRAHRGDLGAVALTGEGVEAAWTIRALERAGYARAAPGEPALASVDVLPAGSGTRWCLVVGEHTAMHTSIGALVADLRARL